MNKLLTALLCFLTLSVNAQTAIDIKFTWPESVCEGLCVQVDGYRLYAVGDGIIADTGNVTTHTETNYAITVGVEQCFTIAAYNAAGNGIASDPACLTVDQTVPQKITLTVTFPVTQ
ncbi:MAG: hypothetical protein JKY93_00770 [Gammaproteobacteria bacterium]|nr:hypothetical protein [Gammaproteobacteria bacterium]